MYILLVGAFANEIKRLYAESLSGPIDDSTLTHKMDTGEGTWKDIINILLYSVCVCVWGGGRTQSIAIPGRGACRTMHCNTYCIMRWIEISCRGGLLKLIDIHYVIWGVLKQVSDVFIFTKMWALWYLSRFMKYIVAYTWNILDWESIYFRTCVEKGALIHCCTGSIVVDYWQVDNASVYYMVALLNSPVMVIVSKVPRIHWLCNILAASPKMCGAFPILTRNHWRV